MQLSKKSIQTKYRLLVPVLTLVFVIILCSFWLKSPDFINDSYKFKYSFLLVFNVFFIVCFFAFNIKDSDIFSPLLFGYVLFYLIFVYRPLYDITRGGIFSSSGKDVSEGCVKATLIFGLGLLFLSIAYSFTKKSGTLVKMFDERNIKKDSRHFFIALFIWSVSFFASILYLLKNGFSLSYIFSFGLLTKSATNNETSFLFLSTLKSCLIASWIYIAIYGKRLTLKILLFILGLIPFVLMGRRAAAIIYFLSPIIYFFLKNNKKINLLFVLIVGIFLLVFIAIIGSNRMNVARGQGLSLSFSDLLLPFDYELTTYRCFYALVESVPSLHNYTFGFNMFVYTLIMLIPRAIWPSKPESPISEIMLISVDQTAVDGGAVFPMVGEFYFEFGILGVVFMMLVLGVILKKLYLLRVVYSGTDNHGLLLFSVEFMVLLQVFTRGNTPSNFYYILLTAFPILFISHLDTTKSFKRTNLQNEEKKNYC